MRVRTAKDVEVLRIKIRDELGIDVQKYQNEKVAKGIAELLIFPEYVVKWVIRPVFWSLLLFIIGFSLLNLVHIEYLIYGIVGFILFMLTGILVGLFLLVVRMKIDIWGIVDYSLKIMESAVKDIWHANKQINRKNRREAMGLLFQGITHIVTIPMMSKVLSEQIPYIGSFVSGIVKRVLTLVADTIDFGDGELDLDTDKTQHEELPMMIHSIFKVSDKLESVMTVTFKVASWPIKIALFFASIFLLLFLYLIN